MSVPLIGPDGREYVLDKPENLNAAIAKGYRVLTAEEPQTLGEQAKAVGSDALDTLGAAGEGGVQGLTAGLYGAMLGRKRGAGESDQDFARRRFEADELQKRKEEHPLAHAAGDFAGMVASPINKLAAPIRGAIGATTAIGRIGAEAVAGGAVGSLFGAGNTMSDAALGDQNLTAEKLFAGVGLGAVLGAGGAGLGTALEEGVRAVVPKVSAALGGVKDPLAEFADQRWLKAGGGIQSDIKKIPEAERAAVADAIRTHMSPAGKVVPETLEDAASSLAAERDVVAKQLLKAVGVGDAGGLAPKMNQEEALEAIGKALDQNGARVGAVLKKADQVGAKPAYSEFLSRLDGFESGLNPAEAEILAPELAKARKYLAGMGAQPVGSPKNSFSALNDLKSTLQKDTNWVADGAAKYGLKRQLVGIIRDEIDTQLAPQIGSDLAKEFLDAKQAYGALSNAEKALGRKTSTGADAIRELVEGSKLAQPSLAGRLSALDHAARLMSHGMDRQLGNRFISLSDYMTGLTAGAMSGGPLGALSGLGSAIGHKILRERGAGVIAKLADTIAQSPRLAATAQSFGTQLQGAAPHLGKYAQPLLQAFANSPAAALATHMTWAQADPEYSETAQRAGFMPETPEEHATAMFRAGGLAGVAKLVEQHDAELDRAVGRVLKGEGKPRPVSDVLGSQDFGAKRMRRDDLAAHRQRMEEIQQLAADPNALVEKVASNLGQLGDVAPGVAAAITRTAHTAVGFLAQEVQTQPKAGPLAPDWVHNDAEIHTFSRMLETVQDPMSVLHHAAAGTLTEDQVRALNAVYPLLGRQIADKMLERIAEGPKGLPYRARLMVGMLTGTDPDGTMGLAVAMNQATIQSASRKPSNAGPDASSSSGKSPVTLAQRTATPSQRSELQRQE